MASFAQNSQSGRHSQDGKLQGQYIMPALGPSCDEMPLLSESNALCLLQIFPGMHQ